VWTPQNLCACQFFICFGTIMRFFHILKFQVVWILKDLGFVRFKIWFVQMMKRWWILNIIIWLLLVSKSWFC
jgi:hypothetical protein